MGGGGRLPRQRCIWRARPPRVMHQGGAARDPRGVPHQPVRQSAAALVQRGPRAAAATFAYTPPFPCPSIAAAVITDLPNLLTLSRILIIPLVVAGFYLNGYWADWVPLGLFAVASITDFFDGYLARSWQQQSALGRFLDPVADKLLIATVILMLVAMDRITGWHVLPALVILLREILVSGLREFLAEARVSVPVSAFAKWKTAIQMLALGFLMAGAGGNAVMPDALPATTVGEYGLWIAAILTLYTGYDYLRAGSRHLTPGPGATPNARQAGTARPAE